MVRKRIFVSQRFCGILLDFVQDNKRFKFTTRLTNSGTGHLYTIARIKIMN